MSGASSPRKRSLKVSKAVSEITVRTARIPKIILNLQFSRLFHHPLLPMSSASPQNQAPHSHKHQKQIIIVMKVEWGKKVTSEVLVVSDHPPETSGGLAPAPLFTAHTVLRPWHTCWPLSPPLTILNQTKLWLKVHLRLPQASHSLAYLQTWIHATPSISLL